jgi:hypothetical protein
MLRYPQVQRHMCTVTTSGPAYLFAPDAANTMNANEPKLAGKAV